MKKDLNVDCNTKKEEQQKKSDVTAVGLSLIHIYAELCVRLGLRHIPAQYHPFTNESHVDL